MYIPASNRAYVYIRRWKTLKCKCNIALFNTKKSHSKPYLATPTSRRHHCSSYAYASTFFLRAGFLGAWGSMISRACSRAPSDTPVTQE